MVPSCSDVIPAAAAPVLPISVSIIPGLFINWAMKQEIRIADCMGKDTTLGTSWSMFLATKLAPALLMPYLSQRYAKLSVICPSTDEIVTNLAILEAAKRGAKV